MCKQCARGGCAFYFRNRGHPLIARLRQHVVPPQPPQLFSIRVSGSPPNPPQGGFLALCFPSQLCRKCAFHSKTELKWIIVGLWVLAACAGRSTRSKGSQRTLRLSHPVRVARKPAKNDFSGFRAGDRAGWRGRPLEPAQKPGSAARGWELRRARSPGSLDSASLGPQTPLRPPKLPKTCVLAAFRENWRSDRPRRPRGPSNLPAWGPRPPWGYPPDPLGQTKNTSMVVGLGSSSD